MKIINEPTECPCCSYPLIKIKDQLFCKNTACEAQVSKKVENFVKVLGIKGLGPKTIEKLQVQELVEIFYLDKDHLVSELGEKTATKLLDEIERAKTASLATVLESFSIPLIGGTASNKLASVISSIDEITQETCKIAGLGAKATSNLLEWVETDYQEMKDFLPFTYKRKDTVADTAGKTVCITGKLKSFKKKADAAEALAAAGYRLVESLTKTTDFLVNEGDNESSKQKKAMEYGIPIITDLNDLIERNKYD